MNKFLLGHLLTGFVLIWSTSAFAEPMYGILMVVKGSVKITNASKQVSAAKVGSRVKEGDMIATEADSRAKVVMADRNVINVNPDTQVVIAKYENDAATGKKNVELNLIKGKVRNNVEQTYDGEKNKFLIKTPTAVAGVRGTQFLAGFDVKTRMTSIVTFKGSVTLASVGPGGRIIGTPVLINKGQTTQSAPDMPPEAPTVVPKDEMNKIEGVEPTREVASEGGVQENSPPPPAPMVDSADMDLGKANEIKDVRTSPPPQPPMATPPKRIEDSIVKDITQGNAGKTKVNVRPVPQN